ncbi:uncharacterized protein LOC126299315 [Schistocerca gregaria]|uniref:uncharacterized protein LOC126299315 n=1 Tax=Schistocerca gregaria TaxID=7010 RepID=UPI00211DB71B|nr:uncharacterized protein LOC126299315 [Schistocerca gregaria]XP_049847090.1 uncharacterized protein LOC126299315 [Schistocerca gregaria]
MAEQSYSRSERCQQGREELLRYAIWNTWRMQGGDLRPYVDPPSVDVGADPSSALGGDLSSSGSSTSSSSDDLHWVSPSERGALLGTTSAPGLYNNMQTDETCPSGCYECEKERGVTAGSPDNVERWSEMDGIETTDECPCCTAVACNVSGSKQQSKMVAFFEDPIRKRAREAQERSKKCQEQRQHLLRTALWNSWCAKSRALCQEPESDGSISESNETMKSETSELLSLPQAVAHRASDSSPVVGECSCASSTFHKEDNSSEPLNCASSKSSDWSGENVMVKAHSESSGVEESSNSFCITSFEDGTQLHDTSCGNSCSDSECSSSDESEFSWSDYEGSDEFDETDE